MKKTILLYGLAGGVLIAVLELVQYRLLFVRHSFEIYGAFIALVFAGVGLWLGLRLTRPRERVVVERIEIPVEVRVPATAPFVRDDARVAALGLTPRELEILEAIAAGLSNREIAGRLFVSENTVKTHAARVFDKLGVARRTQAVQAAREARIIP